MSSSDALQAKGLSWFKDFFATADTLDTRKWLDTFWLPDATVQFSNAPDLSGREVIFSAMDPTFGRLGYMHHVIHWTEVARDKIMVKATITYRAKDDPKHEDFVIPGFAVAYFPGEVQADSTDDRITRLEVYINRTPLEERMASLQK
ncbi:hypothetical protein EV122DRAFT_223761 [Schizophyllum commune]